MSSIWLLIRCLLALPWLVVRVIARHLLGRLPQRWPLPFAVAVAVLHFFVGAILGPLMAGRKLNLPSAPLRGRLGRETERRAGVLGDRPVEWLWPRETASKRCILYLHGGAFVTGSIDTHRPMMAQLAHAGAARVVGLDYRLAPQHPFPAALDDCVAAWQALLDAGEDPRQMVIAGDSAGGGLAASTLLVLKAKGLALPAAAWLVSPAVDLADDRPSWQRNLPFDYLAPLRGQLQRLVPTYLGANGNPMDPLASPVYGELTGLPPLLIHVGEREVLHDQVAAFAGRAQAAGVDTTLVVGADMVHVYPAFLGLVPAAAEAFAEAGSFVQTHTPG